jgi:hypothetical protein
MPAVDQASRKFLGLVSLNDLPKGARGTWSRNAGGNAR